MKQKNFHTWVQSVGVVFAICLGIWQGCQISHEYKTHTRPYISISVKFNKASLANIGTVPAYDVSLRTLSDLDGAWKEAVYVSRMVFMPSETRDVSSWDIKYPKSKMKFNLKFECNYKGPDKEAYFSNWTYSIKLKSDGSLESFTPQEQDAN